MELCFHSKIQRYMLVYPQCGFFSLFLSASTNLLSFSLLPSLSIFLSTLPLPSPPYNNAQWNKGQEGGEGGGKKEVEKESVLGGGEGEERLGVSVCYYSLYYFNVLLSKFISNSGQVTTGPYSNLSRDMCTGMGIK